MRYLLSAAVLLTLGCSPAAAQDTAEVQPSQSAVADERAAQIVLSSARFLESRDQLSFEWFVSSDEVVDGREKLTFVTSGSVEMDRNAGFLMKSERGKTLRDFYFDGSTFTVASPSEQFYASVEVAGTYEELVDRARVSTGLVLPVWTLLTSNLSDRLAEGAKVANYIGTTLIRGQLAHHIAVAGDTEDWQLWVAADSEMPVPIMLVSTHSNKKGWPQLRAHFSSWNTAPKIDAADFSFEPRENDERITMPWLTGELSNFQDPAAVEGTQ